MKKLLYILLTFLNVSAFAQSWTTITIPTINPSYPYEGIRNIIIMNDTLVTSFNRTNGILYYLKNNSFLGFGDTATHGSPSAVSSFITEKHDSSYVYYYCATGGFTESEILDRINILTGRVEHCTSFRGTSDGYSKYITMRNDTLWGTTHGFIGWYDESTNTWTETDTLPNNAMAMTSVGSQIYIITGRTGWGYVGNSLAAGDSTTQGHLYTINDIGKKVDLGQIGDRLIWCTQIQSEITSTDTLLYMNILFAIILLLIWDIRQIILLVLPYYPQKISGQVVVQ